MRARAGAAHVAVPAMARTSAGTQAKTGGLSEEEFDFSEEECDFGQPFEVDLGRAAVIAEALRESGFPLCTADVVTAELARPGHERGMIGRFAADQLERAGWRP